MPEQNAPQPRGEIMEPQLIKTEIVDAILFAIRNDLVNGKTLAIDGGLTM